MQSIGDTTSLQLYTWLNATIESYTLTWSCQLKYIFIEPNIYYFPIPELPDKKYLSIEYYFSDEVLNTPFKDHKLELNIQNKDKEIFYKIGEKGLSKNRFAIHIVRELPKTEFVNFKKIFDIIKEINIDYKSK